MSSNPSHTPQRITDLMLLIFRLNGTLLDRGDQLVAHLGINSARWQVLGAAGLAGEAQTAPQIAARMGISRQGAQKQLHKLVEEGYFDVLPNPQHARSPLYRLSAKGERTVAGTQRSQAQWTEQLARRLPDADFDAACHTLQQLLSTLDTLSPPIGEES
ncbi:MarR family winged helix-turn-helix transcriptional regulator [Chromobacterium haemolyticum]|uniref:HTH marR-type domain-containing protein n=1 Tax=Chromobacterium haemolyticum TaxID=394935 RepID=A0A1W0D7Y1_9NEIS|nr:MarR family winged helix-turn-helix transcriptional regulator [Chromobacterium haemolyticum]OQS43109.1 hypothetical protein B0T45_03835 [Chromobacterium haemolyticum]